MTSVRDDQLHWHCACLTVAQYCAPIAETLRIAQQVDLILGELICEKRLNGVSEV